MRFMEELRRLRLKATAAVAVALAACSGGGAPEPGLSGDDTGTVIVALTDVEGEFTSYTVDVLSIALERAGGERVEMLPQPTRVDFAQLTALTELVGAAEIDIGEIVGGHVRLDYSDAEIYVEAGGEIAPARVFDDAGTLLTDAGPGAIVDVEIRLPDDEHLSIGRGTTSLISIDFDLAASHLVDTTTVPATAIARPYLAAELRPVDDKEVRVRGTLVDVDVEAGTYDIRLRPWLHRFGNFGPFTVATDNETEFEIDTVSYVGREGLEALAAKPAGTLTVAFGTLDLDSHRFSADLVHAGDSVPGGRYAAVLGNIVARSGDELLIKGAVAIRRDRRAHFHRTVIAEIGPDTGVTRIGDPDGSYDKDDLSVGQRVMILGEFANPSVDNSDRFGPDVALVLDATEGRARMLVTRLSGTVNEIVPGRIDIELRAIDRLSADLFDFSGTGISSLHDADPTDYEVATSMLGADAAAVLDTLEPARPVAVLGFVTPFGEAPPDFTGRALIGPRELPAVLGVGWGVDGTAAPFSVMGATSLVIDLANPDIGARHHLLVGDRLIDLFDLPASPGIGESARPRIYGIWEPGHIELFKDFADFVDELALRLSAADRARSLAAYGRYDENENALTANKIVVHMLPADSP